MSELKAYTFSAMERIGLADYYLKSEADKVIAEVKAKLESVQATAYTDSVDAGMENRKLKRALWVARADRAKAIQWHEGLDRYLQERKKLLAFKVLFYGKRRNVSRMVQVLVRSRTQMPS